MAPPEGASATETVPPCALMVSLTIARPSPAPQTAFPSRAKTDRICVLDRPQGCQVLDRLRFRSLLDKPLPTPQCFTRKYEPSNHFADMDPRRTRGCRAIANHKVRESLTPFFDTGDGPRRSPQVATALGHFHLRLSFRLSRGAVGSTSVSLAKPPSLEFPSQR